MDFEELGSSELGTQDYWENRYKCEIKNFRSHGDVGDVWFGEDAGERVIRWIKNCVHILTESKIIDIGCGNGVMLIELAQENFTELYGVDYSETGIALSKEIANKYNYPINFEVCNILSENPHMDNKFDVAHDKGTYDAISLDPVDRKSKRQLYIQNISKLLKPESFLILTSCNWTQDELVEQFKQRFVLHDSIPTPQFKFGGKVGNVVTSIVLKKLPCS